MLRDYQTQGVQALREKVAQGKRRIILHSPTGSGKTTMGVEILRGALARNNACLWLTHRKELLDQAAERMRHEGLTYGVIMSGTRERRPYELLQVASKDTLVNRDLPAAKVIVVDECHRALGNRYMQLLDNYPEAIVIGLTATPCRLDGKPMGSAFDDMVTVATVEDLIAKGWLVAPRVFAPSAPDLKGVARSAGDFNQEQLGHRADTPQLVGDIVDHWLRLARGRRTVCFAVNVQHSLHIVESFRAQGVPAEHVDATTHPDVRAAAIKRLAAGQTLVLSNVGLFTEGWDLPVLEAEIQARPTMSLALKMQMDGRLMRPGGAFPDKILLDHAGNTNRHGFPEDRIEFSLDEKTKRVTDSTTKNCPGCYRVCTTGCTVCPECGHEFVQTPDPEAKPKTIIVGDGELIELTREGKKELYQRLVAEAKARGKKRGWADHEYRRRTGVWPKGVMTPEQLAERAERRRSKAMGLSLCYRCNDGLIAGEEAYCADCCGGTR